MVDLIVIRLRWFGVCLLVCCVCLALWFYCVSDLYDV